VVVVAVVVAVIVVVVLSKVSTVYNNTTNISYIRRVYLCLMAGNTD